MISERSWKPCDESMDVGPLVCAMLALLKSSRETAMRSVVGFVGCSRSTVNWSRHTASSVRDSQTERCQAEAASPASCDLLLILNGTSFKRHYNERVSSKLIPPHFRMLHMVARLLTQH